MDPNVLWGRRLLIYLSSDVASFILSRNQQLLLKTEVWSFSLVQMLQFRAMMSWMLHTCLDWMPLTGCERAEKAVKFRIWVQCEWSEKESENMSSGSGSGPLAESVLMVSWLPFKKMLASTITNVLGHKQIGAYRFFFSELNIQRLQEYT